MATRTSGTTREKACELVAALMKGDRTTLELEGMVSMRPQNIRPWLDAMHDAGLVRRASLRKVGEGIKGAFPIVWSWQRVPFELDDFAP